MRRLWEKAMDDGDLARSWKANAADRLATSRRRMNIAVWTAQAWESLCINKPLLIRNAFVQTGILLRQDGTDEHLVKIKGAANYTF